jgi:hypothetical protein
MKKRLDEIEELLFWLVMSAAVIVVGKAVLDVFQ